MYKLFKKMGICKGGQGGFGKGLGDHGPPGSAPDYNWVRNDLDPILCAIRPFK